MNVAVIGGGPAGLRAAEVAATAGAKITIFDAKPSVGRKFLVAGRGGLNLTHSESHDDLTARYIGGNPPSRMWASLLDEFDPERMRAWAGELGVETFVATSGRVYPRQLKAAPLLRRWMQRLRELGVQFAVRHRWTGLQMRSQVDVEFAVGTEVRTLQFDAVILAVGGGSWPETGSDGAWVKTLGSLGVTVTPLIPANCGWEVAWPAEVLAQAEGEPLKNVLVRAAQTTVAGELLITRYGLEGGAIYQLGPVLRAMPQPTLSIDFKPTFTVEELVAKMGLSRQNFLAETRQRWRLSKGAAAILASCATPEQLASVQALAAAVKGCTLRLRGPRPLVEAISSAGGVSWSELDERLMIRRLPGVFVAGEMIDWEAPTGGYLLQGCFATGTRAGRGAVEWLKGKRQSDTRRI